MPKILYTFRLERMEHVDARLRETEWDKHQSSRPGLRGGHGGRDTGRTALVQHLLDAWTEGRLIEAPLHGVNPFPLEAAPPAGSSPEHPALVTRGTEPPEPVRGWFISEIQGVGVYHAVEPQPSPLTPDKKD